MTSDTNTILDCPTRPPQLTSHTDSITSPTTSLTTSYGTEMTSYLETTSTNGLELTSSHIADTTTSNVPDSSTAGEVLMPSSSWSSLSSSTSSPTFAATTSEVSPLFIDSSVDSTLSMLSTSSVLVTTTWHVQPSSLTAVSPTPSTSRLTSPPEVTSRAPDVTPGPPVTTTEEKTMTDYWPEILGSIFGVAVVVAVVGFLLYRRRRKALLSRQEIYTVTPRMVTTLEENGTAGRSDVPMQMAES
ncbi:uncharacterized protein LOC143282235 [Babylonia areolata]|uniref:uncharacterized protein LOC143282235 n=1 Tax=Babylonia areolata TaxID=304850 RepID=UPI003FD4033A